MSRDTTVEVLLVVLLGLVSKTNGHIPTQPEEWARDDAG
jgi:hypothetical protein